MNIACGLARVNGCVCAGQTHTGAHTQEVISGRGCRELFVRARECDGHLSRTRDTVGQEL